MEGDHHVGQILDTLKELGVEDNTIVVFASDNGPSGEAAREFGNEGTPDMGNAGPFRGELGEVTEGSIRTAAIIRWPGKVKPDTTSYAMFSIMDFLPTFAHIVGGTLPTDRAIDGIDQYDVLLGESAMGHRESLLSFIGGDLVAARWKQWRIYFTDVHPTGIGPQREPGLFSASAPLAGYPLVYNVEMDPHEDLVGRGPFRLGSGTRAQGRRGVPGVGQEVPQSACAQHHGVPGAVTEGGRAPWKPCRDAPVQGPSEHGSMGSHPPSPAALRTLAGGTALLLAASVAEPSRADEDGVSFWLPGTYGSLAAVPGEPGWSIAGILYYTSVSAGRDKAISQGGNVRLGLDSDATLLLLIPSYTLKRPVLGGQAAFSLMGIYGNNSTSVDATLTGPGGNQISGARKRFPDLVRRPLSAGVAEVELGRQQRHGLPDRRHSRR